MCDRRWLSLPTAALLFAALALAGVDRATAVELLISGDFEPPGGLTGEVPGWTLTEFATGSATSVNAAETTGGADVQIFLRAFEGGGPLHPRQGNFDNDSLPRGDVDGVDFLTWQRHFGKTTGALPEEGDATGATDGGPDGMVATNDYDIWKANFGRGAPLLTNARLSQTVPAAPGTTYKFQGTSTFEVNYSGAVATLGNDSPFGQITSPTQTRFRMEFLDASNAVIGAPTVLDLKTEQAFPGFPVVHTPLEAQAPAGTVNVRVVAEALDMAWNGTTTTNGGFQSAFFNDFKLTGVDPNANLLTNGDLNLGTPDALDFWNQQEGPPFTNVDEVLRTAGFANHTTGGSRGVWLSAFLGSSSNIDANWSSVPVDGAISQTVNAIAGGVYTFSGWSRFEGQYSGGIDTVTGGGMLSGQTSPTVTEIRLDFLDVNNAVIGSSVIDVEAERKAAAAGNANDNQWRQHTLMAVAPANTRRARLSASMLDGVYNGTGPQQSAFFDDFSLDGPLVAALAMGHAVPEPSSLVGLALAALVVGHNRRKK